MYNGLTVCNFFAADTVMVASTAVLVMVASTAVLVMVASTAVVTPAPAVAPCDTLEAANAAKQANSSPQYDTIMT